MISESDSKEHLKLKEKIEALRREHGAEFWLRSKSAAEVEDLIGIGSVDKKFSDEVALQNAEKLLFTKV